VAPHPVLPKLPPRVRCGFNCIATSFQLTGNGLRRADWRYSTAPTINIVIRPKLGWGTLNVKKMLDSGLATKLIESANAGELQPSAEDSVSDPFSTLWNLILGIGPPNSEEERMYETEVVQTVLASRNSGLRAAARRAASGASFKPTEQARLRTLLLEEKISDALRHRIE
jgi:hypothetical protein